MEAWLDVVENRGDERRLVDQICKKLRRGMDVEQIAEEVEEDVIRVQLICNIAEKYAPGYDTKEVFKEVEKELLAESV